MAEEKPTPLEPSKLGTREYWDALYTTEISNHQSNPSDEGTVWFDDSDAESKILDFLLASLTTKEEPSLDPSTASVLDLGSGNGSLLFLLRSEGGFTGPLLGVDYSANSVRLAKQIAQTRHENDGLDVADLEFKGWDVLNGPLDAVRNRRGQKQRQQEEEHQEQQEEKKKEENGNVKEKGGKGEAETEAENEEGWDLVLDKGTFDAVSLSSDLDKKGRRINEGYGERVLQLLKLGGYFLVTSCNWTEAELQKWFEDAADPTELDDDDDDAVVDNEEANGGTKRKTKTKLKMVGRIEYPSFSFGGVKGQTISTLCFEKVVV